MKIVVFVLSMILVYPAIAQHKLITVKTNSNDQISNSDTDIGSGDDGIYDIDEPSFSSDKDSKVYPVSNLVDFNLKKAWVFKVDNTKKPVVLKAKFDLSATKYHVKKIAFKLNTILFYNGYRKSENLWKDNSRIKSFKLFINDKYIETIIVRDTYKGQLIDVSSYNVHAMYGEVFSIKFIFDQFYYGRKYISDVAISEIEFIGIKYN